MDLDELVPSESKYLKKEDVGEQGRNLTIRGFDRAELDSDSGKQIKAIVLWEEDAKPLVLNVGNKERLKAICGATTTEAVTGKVINVYNDPMVSFGTKVTGGIRIRPASVDNDIPPTPPMDFNDDIPI